MAETKARNKFDIDEELDVEFNKEQMVKLLHYVSQYKKLLIVTIMITLISIGANLLMPLLLSNAIDDYIPNKEIHKIIWVTIFFLVAILVSSISMKFKIRYISRIGHNIVADIRTDIFTHIQKLPFTYFDSRPHGKILVRVVNYVNALSDLLSNGFINLITDLFTFIATLMIMLWLNWQLTLVVLGCIPIAAFFMFLIKSKQRKSMQEVSSKQSNLTAYIQESISGLKVTQSFTREQVNFEIFNNLMDEYQDHWMKSRRYIVLVFPIVKNASIISQILMIIFGLFIIPKVATAGVLVAFLGYSSMLWMPLLNISEFYNQLVSASAYVERIFETLEIEPDIKNAANAYELPEIIGEVTFKDVEFGYEADQVILEDFNLQVKAGESIALVGPTGAGKTTIVNLISRFYEVREGEVLIDGHNVKEVTLESLRTQMGIMMQDTFIFSGTVIDNIRYGRLEATDEEVMEAAKAVKAHDFIIQMEEGYYTQVNERGSRLSTGQRQLISFARALLANPKILILDEATSSIDTKTEQQIQIGLKRLLEGRTSFVIAHRLSTIKNSDRILVINHKGIEEAGTHEELLALKGHYYHLYESQIKFLKDA
jgi:ATP-binding cassette subfamily B protein